MPGKIIKEGGEAMSQKPDQDLTALFIGVAAGTLVGATAALLLAPKSGEKLRRDICTACGGIHEKAKGIAHDIADMGCKACETANEYAEGIKDSATSLLGIKKVEPNLYNYLTIGALAGTVISALALSVYSSKYEGSESLAHRIKAAGKTAKNNLQSIDWFETAKEALDSIKDRVESAYEGRRSGHSALDWAIFGLNLLQNVKKRR